MTGYERGLVEIADGVFAYLQPDGSWGWSNAGLCSGDGASTLVDTLFDLRLTQEMLDEMATVTDRRPIEAVVNTHANGDHCYGNQLVAHDAVAVYASAAAAAEIDDVPASQLAALVDMAPAGALGDFVRHAFGPFDFHGIDVPPPTDTFTGRRTITVGGRTIELIEVGPAHTGGDIIAWLPDERVLFAGDILFIGGTPVMWAGPVSNWIAACDLIVSLDPAVVVPGHGPLTTASGAVEVGDYLRHVKAGVEARHAAGMTAYDAARDLDAEIDGTPFAQWGDRERLVVTVHAIWRELDPRAPRPGVLELLTMMGEDYVRRASGSRREEP